MEMKLLSYKVCLPFDSNQEKPKIVYRDAWDFLVSGRAQVWHGLPIPLCFLPFSTNIPANALPLVTNEINVAPKCFVS